MRRVPVLVLSAAALLGACRSASAPIIVASDASDTGASVDSAPPPVSSAATAAGPPAMERSCNVDADCAVAQVEVSGGSVCCGSCGTTPGSKRWYADLQRFCGPLPTWSNPKCGPLACPMGPTVAICRDHRCEATWIGADGGPAFVSDEKHCVPAWVCNAWSGCALVGGNTQNGYFVRTHDHVPRGELATMVRVCPGDAGCFDAAKLAAVCTAALAPGPAGYTCRLEPADHEAPEGHCVVAPTR